MIAFITKIAVIPVAVIADPMAITAVNYNGCNSLYGHAMTFTILHILVINSVKDTVILAAISITAIMATLDVIDIRVRRPLNVTKVTISLVGLVAVFHLITPIAVMM